MENCDKWEISSVKRIGLKSTSKNRPILVSLTLKWRKILLLKNNKKFEQGTYVTEDFPKEVIEKRKELKIKLVEAIKNGKTAKIHYDELIIKDKPKEKRKRSPSASPKILSKQWDSTKNPSKVNKTNVFESRTQTQASTSTIETERI